MWENPSVDDVMPAFFEFQAMPVPYVEPRDISNAVLYLASDEARYVTGINLRIDAGSLIKYPDGPKG
jgi:NAD(P)-dependent dehydrogenase (short-subunit alcohol dehydrogenase family)